MRMKSDSDLSKINRRATFESVFIDPGELLVEFVGAFSGASSRNMFDEMAASFMTEDEKEEEIFRGVVRMFDTADDKEKPRIFRRRTRKRKEDKTINAKTKSKRPPNGLVVKKSYSTEQLIQR